MPEILVMVRKSRLFTGLAIAAGVGLICCLAFSLNLFYTAQRQSEDFLFRAANLHQEAGAEERIVIIGIDDKSLAELGQFSLWPRTYYAKLINILAEAEARVIVFDILFSESTPGDEELATSLQKAGNVVLPLVVAPTTKSPPSTMPSSQSSPQLRPLAIFEKQALALGHANIIPDVDGLVRRVAVIIGNGNEYEPSLSLVAAAKYLRRPSVIESPPDNDSLAFAGRLIPLISNKEMIINYAGNLPQGEKTTFRTVSFTEVLNSKLDAAIFRDRIVLVGATAIGLADIFGTPQGQMMHGVGIHASAIRTILTGAFLKPASPWATLVLILMAALICGLAVLRLRIFWAIIFTICLSLLYLVLSFSFFDRGIMLNMLYPPLAVAGTFLATNIYNLTRVQAEKAEIISTFGRFTAPPVVDRILASLKDGRVNLGGDVKEITVAFADIRGFSGIAEKMRPEELVAVLNEYLSVIIQTVLKYGGMVNKFGGDSVMAVWNVPLACERHAQLAIEAAISAQYAVQELQNKNPNLLKLEFGIGINTGDAIAGTMGTEVRLEYSVIGDAVNTAARITGAAPGGSVWIGASTYAQAKDYIIAKPLDPMHVKGKDELIQAYEVIDIRDWYVPAESKR